VPINLNTSFEGGFSYVIIMYYALSLLLKVVTGQFALKFLELMDKVRQ
jgi:hypothetical protein